MCKCLNPCCCVPSGVASAIVALLDILIGGVTLFFNGIAIYRFKDAREYLDLVKVSDDVAWFGIISIPLVGFIGLWSGFKLFWSLLTNNTKESNHILKFVVFFLAEVLGFACPFYFFEDYVFKIRTLRKWSSDFIVFHLLEVNPITLGLFIYQILSFWVVHRHQLLKEEEAKARLPKRRVVQLKSSAPPECPVTEKQLAVDLQNKTPQSLNGNASPVYPNLNELMLDLLPSPDYPKPDHFVLDIDWTDTDSDLSSTVESSTFRKRNGLESKGRRTQFQIKKQKFMQKGSLFEDTKFPANNSSLGSGQRFEWKRPHEIVENARFFTDGFSRFDVKQGALGDCWFLAAVANLTLNDNLFTQVVPPDNEWADGLYCGMCHFRFWVNGEWTEVIIDDRLPTRNGKLVYLQSSDKTEFWSALLEKAYAKLNGSYSNLNGNDGIGRAMTNLTGGTVTRHYLNEYVKRLDKLFELMNRSLNHGKMLGCCCRRQRNEPKGIVEGHAYSITHVKKIELMNGKQIPCIRIRNPWGTENEWSGTFSDRHDIWNLVEKKIRKELQVIFKSDGEFWFPLKELADFFDMVEICHLP